MTIFNIYFSYPFERTLPHRFPLDRHQCQWLDMLCKLECESKNVIFFASQQRVVTAKFFGMYPRLILIIPHLFCIVKFFIKKYLHKIGQHDIVYVLQLKTTLKDRKSGDLPESCFTHLLSRESDRYMNKNEEIEMRISPLLIIVIFLILIIGWAVYLEIGNRNFSNSLPKAPIVKQSQSESSEMQHSDSREHAPEEQSVAKTITDTPPEAQSFEKEQSTDGRLQEATENYDWREDTVSVSDLSAAGSDPWQNQESLEETQDNGTLITDPETMPPDELWDAIRNQLIEKFGDIPQVYQFTEMNRKMEKHIPITLDERIVGIEAALYLFPTEGTRRHLEHLRKIQADVRAGKIKEPVWSYDPEPRVRGR